MKKLLLTSAMIVMSSSVMAKDYGAAGCGLGSKLFEGQSGLGPHVFAATTNGFYGTQTFAMTSGTLGCDVTGTIHSHFAATYIEGNMDNVASAIAVGEGEALNALANAFGIEEKTIPYFNETLNQHFSTIYPSQSVSSQEVFDAIVSIINQDATLKQYAI